MATSAVVDAATSPATAQRLLDPDPLALALCTNAGDAMWVASDDPMLDELAASLAATSQTMVV